MINIKYILNTINNTMFFNNVYKKNKKKIQNKKPPAKLITEG